MSMALTPSTVNQDQTGPADHWGAWADCDRFEIGHTKGDEAWWAQNAPDHDDDDDDDEPSDADLDSRAEQSRWNDHVDTLARAAAGIDWAPLPADAQQGRR